MIGRALPDKCKSAQQVISKVAPEVHWATGPESMSAGVDEYGAGEEAVLVEFTPTQALRLRMGGLLLRDRRDGADRPADVAGVVAWLGAMQAQDLASGLWSFGVRLPAYTVSDV